MVPAPTCDEENFTAHGARGRVLRALAKRCWLLPNKAHKARTERIRLFPKSNIPEQGSQGSVGF